MRSEFKSKIPNHLFINQINEVLAEVSTWPVGRDDIYPDYVKDKVLEYKAYVETLNFILQYRQSFSKSKVLDVGTSVGIIPLVLKKYYNIEAYVLDHPKENAFKPYFEVEGISFSCFDLMEGELPYPDEMFDIIVFNSVIEHLSFSPKTTLQSFYRILKSEGRLIIFTPNIARLSTRIKLLFGKTIHPPLHYFFHSDFPFPGHYREYTLDELRRMIIWSGFIVEKAGYANRTDALFLYRMKPRFAQNRYHRITWVEILFQGIFDIAAFLKPSLAQGLFVIARKPSFTPIVAS